MTEKRGFTLIELLVVISTITLLIALFMPVLNFIKKQAIKQPFEGKKD